MPNYNTNFKLDLHDIDLIESALQTQKNEVSKRRLALIDGGTGNSDPELLRVNATLSDINGLMGRLHNQKVFFRPKMKPYVSG